MNTNRQTINKNAVFTIFYTVLYMIAHKSARHNGVVGSSTSKQLK